ncbi:hypothetical protein [Microcella sp.]|uniref:hypothetical protein n=1 Tax=Microcella sp. TaxID=1913979 RepID=UPI00391ADAF6
MPRRSLTLRAAAVLAAAVLGASLAACSDTTRIPPAPTGTDAAEPLFASDEEALAAAVEAYEEFLAVSAAILQDGGADPERLRPLVSDEVYELESAGFQEARDSGLRLVGANELLHAELQQWSVTGDRSAEVITYVCLSNEEADIVDEAGESVVTEDRVTRLTFEVIIEFVSKDTLISSSAPWTGASVCP